MKLLIFDTETTGLPKDDKIIADDKPDNWPHIVSISWAVLDTETNNVLKQHSYIIRPINWTVPIESTNIHGISNYQAFMQGYDLQEVMLEFITEECDMLAAHNVRFDYHVLRNAMRWDLGWKYNPIRKPTFCTMQFSKDICMLPGRNGTTKNPKLSELYTYTTKTEPDSTKLHSSEYDVIILTHILKFCEPLRSKMNLMYETVKKQQNDARTTYAPGRVSLDLRN
jgi:DNA polymerase III epsilon subunit-like protein